MGDFVEDCALEYLSPRRIRIYKAGVSVPCGCSLKELRRLEQVVRHAGFGEAHGIYEHDAYAFASGRLKQDECDLFIIFHQGEVFVSGFAFGDGIADCIGLCGCRWNPGDDVRAWTTICRLAGDVLDMTSLGEDDISCVFLCGDSRIVFRWRGFLDELLASRRGPHIVSLPEADGYGAALQSAVWWGDLRGVLLLNTLNRSITVALHPRGCFPPVVAIPKDTTLPTRRTLLIPYKGDDAYPFGFDVMQEAIDADSKPELLGAFSSERTATAPENIEGVEVSFFKIARGESVSEYDENAEVVFDIDTRFHISIRVTLSVPVRGPEESTDIAACKTAKSPSPFRGVWKSAQRKVVSIVAGKESLEARIIDLEIRLDEARRIYDEEGDDDSLMPMIIWDMEEELKALKDERRSRSRGTRKEARR